MFDFFVKLDSPFEYKKPTQPTSTQLNQYPCKVGIPWVPRSWENCEPSVPLLLFQLGIEFVHNNVEFHTLSQFQIQILPDGMDG